MPLGAPVHWAAGSDREMIFGVTGDAAPIAASSRVARYSCAPRTAFSLITSGFQSWLGTESCCRRRGDEVASTADRSAPTCSSRPKS